MKKSGTTRRVVIFAGRFTVTKAQFFAALDYVFGPQVAATDVLLTEVSPERYGPWLRAYCKTHKPKRLHFYHPKPEGGDECAIISIDRLVHRHHHRLTHLRIKVGRTQPIEEISAKVYRGPWWGVWHSPAHNDGLRKGVWATVVYLSALPRLRAWLRRKSQARHGAGFGGDWNVGLQRPDKRAQLLGNATGYHFAYPERQGRQIVGLATNMQVLETHELITPHGYDHPLVLVLVVVP